MILANVKILMFSVFFPKVNSPTFHTHTLFDHFIVLFSRFGYLFSFFLIFLNNQKEEDTGASLVTV